MSSSSIFSCTQCGDCCNGYGGTYLTTEDVSTISRFVSVSEEKFKKKYCSRSGKRLVLAQRSDGYCVFWEGNCSIHPVKPKMCRNWPYIESVLIDPINWRVMSGMCPGIKANATNKDIIASVRAHLSQSSDDD